MSESEKLKRAEYQKNRKKTISIILAVILGLSILTVTFSCIFVVLDADTYVYFQENGSVVYHAYLNDNEYYEEERLNGGHAYVSSLIQKMDAAFTYRVQMDADDVTYRYQYRVDSRLVILDRNSGAPIYNPVETILGPTVSTYRGKTLTIDPIVSIDYVHYNDKAKAFIENYHLKDVSAQLNVTMYVDIVGMSEKFAQDSEGQYYVQVMIPLNQDIIKPQTTSTIPQGAQTVLANPHTNKTVFKALATYFGILDGIALAVLAYYILTTRDEHIDYERKVQRLVSSYKSFIQKINTAFDSTGYQVLAVDTFREMLEIRDTLQLPILMFENEDKTRSEFMIPTNTNLLYVFDIKVDHYDELYAGGEDTSSQAE
ncbi:MAG: hypothetical protein IJD35_04320 [Clostridia bacterium]|nr:hypothetical protein [Clostridia bacterium]